MASAPLSPAAGVTVCARAGIAVPVANTTNKRKSRRCTLMISSVGPSSQPRGAGPMAPPAFSRYGRHSAATRSSGRPAGRACAADRRRPPRPILGRCPLLSLRGLAGAFSGWKGGFPIVRASFRLARASADAYRRLLTRRADLNQQGWAAIDSPAASRIRIANRGHRRGRQFAGKPSHCKRNRRHFPNTMTCHLACWQLDANQLSSGGDAKIHQAAERDKRLKCQ